MEQKRFTKNDSGFICAACGKDVPPLGYSSRNHCPYCLSSLHVDVFPGDRQNACGGIMRPVHAEPDARRGYILYQKCEKCGTIGKNRAAADDDVDFMIRLTAMPL